LPIRKRRRLPRDNLFPSRIDLSQIIPLLEQIRPEGRARMASPRRGYIRFGGEEVPLVRAY
jgi:hypothetical protein